VPRGTMALAGGKLAVTELGEWSEVELAASLSDDVFRVDRFTGRGKKGRFDLHAEAKGLARKGAPADVTAALKTDGLLLARAGEELGTLTLDAAMTGKLARARLDAEVRVARAELRLPSKLSTRKIQPLGGRVDVVVGPFRKAGARAEVRPPPAQPFEAKVHLLAANQLIVRSDNPRVDVEAKADLTAEWSEQTLWISGVVETLRGDVEPLGGRVFDLKRARVTFTGGEWSEGGLEVTAVWTNPVATVTTTIGGTLLVPEVKLTSQPTLDETQIALLIATGNRTELKPDTGGVSPLNEAGVAALGALSQQFVKDVVADKLPVDTISVDASQLRAGKYLGPKLYVGYTRRWQARNELGENTNELRLEYQISPRWNFEARAGDAGTGGGSLIWSKDY
jgi:translocation and assembly module TamB